ncbi:MAG: hypothetical protein MPN21_17880 [Thermoanaerobaculia bacterium]|nr:hypothetical protein [Thermoanaerobaculia bacterium]
MALAPALPDIIYASGSVFVSGLVHKTADGGDTWADCSTESNLPNANSRTLTVDPGDPDSAWVAVKRPDQVKYQSLYRTRDGGSYWAEVASLGNVFISEIAFHHGWVLAATWDGVFRMFAGVPDQELENGDLPARAVP